MRDIVTGVPLFLPLMKKKRYRFEGCPVFLEAAEYTNNTLAIIMFNEDGDKINLCFSVCICKI
jgi:hypothetical protein